MRFRMLPAAAALAATFLLVGCVPPEPIITPQPEPDATPVFASDEEALAAATAAYAKYVAVSDDILHDPSQDLSVLGDVSTGELLQSNIEGFINAREKQWHSVGQTSFDQVALQRYDRGDSIEDLVVAYVCEDVSEVAVMDTNGRSVVSPDRPSRVLYEVSFDLSSDGKSLKVSNRTAWSSESC